MNFGAEIDERLSKLSAESAKLLRNRRRSPSSGRAEGAQPLSNLGTEGAELLSKLSSKGAEQLGILGKQCQRMRHTVAEQCQRSSCLAAEHPSAPSLQRKGVGGLTK